jgi:hypothetical protein
MISCTLFFIIILVVLGLELRAFTLSLSTSPILFVCVCVCEGFFKIGSRKLFARLALNHDPLDLCLLSS